MDAPMATADVSAATTETVGYLLAALDGMRARVDALIEGLDPGALDREVDLPGRAAQRARRHRRRPGPWVPARRQHRGHPRALGLPHARGRRLSPAEWYHVRQGHLRGPGIPSPPRPRRWPKSAISG